jgi:hypothetical protein
LSQLTEQPDILDGPAAEAAAINNAAAARVLSIADEVIE